MRRVTRMASVLLSLSHVAVLTVCVACARRSKFERAVPTSSASARAPASAPASAPAPAPAPAPALPSDGGVVGCRLLRGPIELPLRGAPALALRGESLHAVLNNAGRPRVVSFSVDPITATAPPRPELSPNEVGSGLSIPCAVGGDQAYCPDPTGQIHRTTLGTDSDRIVASSRAGTRVAASVLGSVHPALAYLTSNKTADGWVTDAWLAIDDARPVRLSEGGSGATAVTLGVRGHSLLALTLDARAALTALHARTIAYEQGAKLAEDVVLFVAGPTERGTRVSAALRDEGAGWALLPISKDVRDFGMLIVRVDDPPRIDEPAVWSLYPNGLDAAPIAVATGQKRTWVARVRPESAGPASTSELELGELSDDGVFAARDVVPTRGHIGDVAMALDPRGGLWVAWADASGSWLERLQCR